MKILPPKKIKVVDIKGKGRGVVAIKNIKKGEVIEYCPVVFISKKEVALFTKEKTTLNFYYLIQPETKKLCLMLGYGALYNHSKTPNAEIDYDTKEIKNYLLFKALRAIKIGEEILFDYQFDDDKEDFLK
jgi:SET domain-containing protein